MESELDRFFDTRDLGRPLSCQTCPIREVCFICSMREGDALKAAPSTDGCRKVWSEITEWVNTGELAEVANFRKEGK